MFDGVCVHCAVHDQHGLRGWVGTCGYIVSLTWVSSLFRGCCLFVVLVVLARGLHPVSFPNLEVKPFCADGTATGGLWESRALPTVSLSEWTGGCWLVCGLVFPGLLFCLWFCCLFGVVFGGWLLRPPPIFYVFMGHSPLKVVKDTPAVRRQTY